jgi:hypothetical protein
MTAALHAATITLATARATRLATTDQIAGPARTLTVDTATRIHPRLGQWAADLLACPHCTGFWAAAAIVVADRRWHNRPAWQAILHTLAVSYLAGHLSAQADR